MPGVALDGEVVLVVEKGGRCLHAGRDQVVHSCAEVFDEGEDLRGLALRFEEHGAAGFVANPACDVVLPGEIASGCAEADPLNTARETDAGADRGCDRVLRAVHACCS